MAKFVSLSSAVRTPARHFFSVLVFYSLLFTVFFAPVIFRGMLLAPADGLSYHLAFFQSRKVFWDSLLASGFPMIADPQVMAWYPPAMIFSFLPAGWNLFVMSAYVMASCFTYGYVYKLTNSKLSSLLSGMVYGLCGFMIAHLGHTAIIHAAAWPPLILWALESLRHKLSRAWFAVGCFAVACCVLAGHLQIVAHGLVLSALYAFSLGWKAPVGRARYFLASALVLLLGLGLAALQILPTAELASLSTRSDYGFADFVSYSLPLNQVVLLIFPAVFGGVARYGQAQYFGAWNLTELTGYVGLLPLLLAVTGFSISRRKSVSIFWLCVIVLAFLLTLGNRTPLAAVLYYLPLLGKFRVPARHFMELSLAVSILSGIGLDALLRRTVSAKRLLGIMAAMALVVIAVVVFLLSKHGALYRLADENIVSLNTIPWRNPTVAAPLIILVIAGAALFYFYRQPQSTLRGVLLFVVLLLDLGSFGWFYEWRNRSPRAEILNPPPTASELRRLLDTNHQRIVPVRGVLGVPSELPPNLSRLWQVPSATGYGPLNLSRLMSLLSMRTDASLDPSWKEFSNQSLDLAAVRYVTLPHAAPLKDSQGILWNPENIDFWLGGGCDVPQNKSIKFEFNQPIQATTVGIVSRLACSMSIPDGTEVLRVSVTDADGNNEIQSLLAGRDTSEWAFDCRTIKPLVKHRLAKVFSSFQARMNSEPCQGHSYVAMLPLSKVRNIKRFDLVWTGHTEALSLEKLTFVDGAAQKSTPVDPLPVFSQWRLVRETEDARVYENPRALPRAWLASETVTLKPDEALKAIKTSRLPDGRLYDALHMALVEEPTGLGSQPADPSGSARIVSLSDRIMEVQTSSTAPSFLVTSDIHYPGWRVQIDDQPGQIFLANYAFRGVKLPAGNHRVRFEFIPKRFYYGASISAFTLLVLLAVVVIPFIRGKPTNQQA
jgi:hypothetical protein